VNEPVDVDAIVAAAVASMAEARPPQFSDDGLALEFSHRHDGQLLYVATWGQWLRWDGMRWAADTTLAVYDLARAVCREMGVLAEVQDPKRGEATARDITSSSTVASVERMARSDRRHARAAEQFDSDPWALNTPGGVLDLRTGRMRAHRRDDLFTKVTGATPENGIPWRWLRFLLQITQGDKAMVRYLQRFIGYSLTGSIDEHAFAFLCGPGGNGKSVLLATVAAMLGGYGTVASSDVFVVGRHEQHPTHLASLRGARMVLVSEVEPGRAWAESRIKSLTGGDRISARFMRGDLFEFAPIFKLWVAGNHRPVLRNPDPAMRRRMHLMPLTFVPAHPDLELTAILHAELPRILAWSVKGCLAWQRQHLAPPAVVREATDSYFAEQDSLAAWVAERCKRDAFATTTSRTLFSDWKAWMAPRGEDAGNEKLFSEGLERHFAKKRLKTGMAFVGVRLLPSDTGAW